MMMEMVVVLIMMMMVVGVMLMMRLAMLTCCPHKAFHSLSFPGFWRSACTWKAAHPGALLSPSKPTQPPQWSLLARTLYYTFHHNPPKKAHIVKYSSHCKLLWAAGRTPCISLLGGDWQRCTLPATPPGSENWNHNNNNVENGKIEMTPRRGSRRRRTSWRRPPPLQGRQATSAPLVVVSRKPSALIAISSEIKRHLDLVSLYVWLRYFSTNSTKVESIGPLFKAILDTSSQYSFTNTLLIRFQILARL